VYNALPFPEEGGTEKEAAKKGVAENSVARVIFIMSYFYF
jgi:hypothetical protein